MENEQPRAAQRVGGTLKVPRPTRGVAWLFICTNFTRFGTGAIRVNLPGHRRDAESLVRAIAAYLGAPLSQTWYRTEVSGSKLFPAGVLLAALALVTLLLPTPLSRVNQAPWSVAQTTSFCSDGLAQFWRAFGSQILPNCGMMGAVFVMSCIALLVGILIAGAGWLHR